jgi:myo-inositol-1(or 4)-monophosphatase
MIKSVGQQRLSSSGLTNCDDRSNQPFQKMHINKQMPEDFKASERASESTGPRVLRGDINTCMVQSVRLAGQILMSQFCKVKHFTSKESFSSIVCAADLMSEECVLKRIVTEYPEHNIIAEESGFLDKGSRFTWIVDPLDGTSNFIASIPWFGVQIALLKDNIVFAAAMYLPLCDTLYMAARGKGAFRNGKRLRLPLEKNPKNVLCGFGMDLGLADPSGAKGVQMLDRLSRGVRNIRATNSLVDFCYTLDGSFGGFVNLNTKIWDIAPICLIIEEAGGKLTDLHGNRIRFHLHRDALQENYEVLGASKVLHPKLFKLLNP